MKKSCMSSKGRAGSLEGIFGGMKKIQPVVHMVLTPLGVCSKSHSEASMVGQIFAKGEVPVHRGVGDGVIGILGGKAGLYYMKKQLGRIPGRQDKPPRGEKR